MGTLIDKAYEDKLEGRIDEGFFQRKRLEWDAERAEALELIRRLDRADRGNLDLGIQVLELADEAYDLYSRQEHHEQRVLLCSNCEIGGGVLKAELRKPFCYLRNLAQDARDDKAPSEGSEGARPKWWALLDDVRTWAVGLQGWNEADSGRVRMAVSAIENIDCSL